MASTHASATARASRRSSRPPSRPPLRRGVDGRWLAGVCGGLAVHLGVPVRAVRVGMVALAALAGVGVVAYLLLWALVPAVADPTGHGHTSGDGASDAGPPPSRGPLWSPAAGAGGQLVAGAALVGLGGVALGERAGIGGASSAVVPASVALAGAVVVWGQLDVTARGRWLLRAGGGARDDVVRLACGIALAAVGLLLLAVRGSDASALGPATASAVAVLAGIGLLLAPWAMRLLRELQAERAGRLREAERAEVAAHLHDSVLQTLALIQRSSGDPVAVSRLARAQERELRAWLFGGARADAGDPTSGTLADTVREVVAAAEDDHGVAVELVVVGDGGLDRATDALVAALREAVVNAVRHGRAPVQVYVETSSDMVEAFVRDHGDGFDPGGVSSDRLGVRESILGRMARAGGRASIRPAPGGGTEVALTIARPEDVG